MQLDFLSNDSHTLSLTIWGITIAILFVIMVVGVYRSFKFSRASRREITERVRGLLLGDMLSRLNISLSRYYRHTSDLDRERHTSVCEHCPDPEKCQSMLLGEDINPATFCPNYDELKTLNPARRVSQKNSDQDINRNTNPTISTNISNAH